jgi:hypothetical protein
MRLCADTCSLTVRLKIFCRMDKLALFRFTTEQGAMEPPYVLTLIVVPRNMQISNTCIHMHMLKMHRRRWCLRSNRQDGRLEPADQVSFPHAVDITSPRGLRHTPWRDFGAPDESVVQNRRRHAAVQLTQQVLQPDPEPHPYSMPVSLSV